MNEIELIRRQLATERAHAGAVASACAAAGARAADKADGGQGAEFAQACVDYLVCVLAWFEERDQRAGDLADRLRPRGTPAQRALAEALARPGRSREALEKLERAVAADRDAARRAEAPSLWREFAHYFESVWKVRRETIDARLAEGLRAPDWREVAGIDADSILAERRYYERVRDAIPAHVTLPEAAAPPSR
jgi:hypothetical protein